MVSFSTSLVKLATRQGRLLMVSMPLLTRSSFVLTSWGSFPAHVRGGATALAGKAAAGLYLLLTNKLPLL
jgi:hypothetical protein